MLRISGISLLLFGLLLAGIDGFRVHDRVSAGVPSSTTAATEQSDVHISENGSATGWPK
jgi:hypothetical protein